MENMETVKNTEELIKRELRKVVDKGSLNPAEMDVVHKAVDSLEKITKLEKTCEEIKLMKEQREQYSGAYHGMNGYPHMTPRSMPHASYGWECHSLGYPAASEYGDMHGGVQHPMKDHYSGHSIHDRMVEQLERMMDTANSEFERQQILKEIKMIRNSPDRLG